MTIPEILIEANRQGIRLEPHGKRQLAYYYDLPPSREFLKLLRQNKSALLRMLQAKRHLARQVLEKEFDGADARTWHRVKDSLLVNLHDPQCAQAIEHLLITSR